MKENKKNTKRMFRERHFGTYQTYQPTKMDFNGVSKWRRRRRRRRRKRWWHILWAIMYFCCVVVVVVVVMIWGLFLELQFGVWGFGFVLCELFCFVGCFVSKVLLCELFLFVCWVFCVSLGFWVLWVLGFGVCVCVCVCVFVLGEGGGWGGNCFQWPWQMDLCRSSKRRQTSSRSPALAFFCRSSC